MYLPYIDNKTCVKNISQVEIHNLKLCLPNVKILRHKIMIKKMKNLD